jgi:hypothetical protein
MCETRPTMFAHKKEKIYLPFLVESMKEIQSKAQNLNAQAPESSLFCCRVGVLLVRYCNAKHFPVHLKPPVFYPTSKFGKEVLVHGRVLEGREEDTWVLDPWPTPGRGECWDREEAEIREIASIWMEGGRMSSRGRYRSGMLLCQCGHQWIPR